MFFGVGQKISPRDSNVARFITVLVSSGCVFCLGRLLVSGCLDGGNDSDDDDGGGWSPASSLLQ